MLAHVENDVAVRVVEDCINENILKDFLTAHKREVIDIIRYDWAVDNMIELRVEEAARKQDLEYAKKLLDRGMDVNTTADITGLTVDDVLRLK